MNFMQWLADTLEKKEILEVISNSTRVGHPVKPQCNHEEDTQPCY